MEGFVHAFFQRFTPLELTVAVAFYITVRAIAKLIIWSERQALRFGSRAFKNERHYKIHRHVHDGHKGSPRKCQHVDCADIVASIAEMTL